MIIAIETFLVMTSGNVRLVIFTDNRSVECSFVKGSSRNNNMNKLLMGFALDYFEKLKRRNLSVVIKRVCSRNNPADKPSRGDFMSLLEEYRLKAGVP